MSTTAHSPSTPSTERGAEQSYEERLQTLSEASVEQHFDAFADIDWDSPELAIDENDERWILPETDVLGRSAWYRSLPVKEQIRVGLYRQANTTKVGSQFEQLLISGLMNYCFGLPNGNPEFRYSMHEATEECHHIQMFQEFVNRTGAKVRGGTIAFRGLSLVMPTFARFLPVAFFFGVLAGEEPIDHVQKSVLRQGANTPPLLQRIMQIHVAEEARHIGFAHQYLARHTPQLRAPRRFLVSLTVPVLMRWLCDEILKPSRYAQKQLGIPDEVMKDVFWEDPGSRKFLRDLFGDVRMLVQEAGLMNPAARAMWRKMKIDGRPSRYRSEPATAAA